MIEMSAPDRHAIAQQCDVAEQYLYQVLTRRKVASPSLCVLIERATGGNVTRRDLQAATITVLLKDGETAVRFISLNFPQVEPEERENT